MRSTRSRRRRWSAAASIFADRFHATTFWRDAQTRGATVVYLLGAMVPMLLAQPAGAHEREHRVRIGLGPGVPAAAGEAFRARTGVTLLEGYGSTETNFVICTAPDSPRRGVMGWLRPGFDARVVDDHDVELPAGEAGELVLRADEPFTFATGYFGQHTRRSRPGATCGSTPATAWCATPTARFASSIASRTRSAAAARTSRRGRSSRR